jgi:hypothetical protein
MQSVVDLFIGIHTDDSHIILPTYGVNLERRMLDKIRYCAVAILPYSK